MPQSQYPHIVRIPEQNPNLDGIYASSPVFFNTLSAKLAPICGTLKNRDKPELIAQ